MKEKRKLLVIGAGGVIGTHIASMSANEFDKLILVDIEPIKEKLNAIARDIRTQLSLSNSNVEVFATTNYDEIEKLSENDVIVIPAGKARDPNDKNSTREALFEFNRKIVDSIGKTLKEKVFLDSQKQPLIIVLTNPVDSILKSMVLANNLDPKKTIGSGNQLDTMRFIQNLADILHVEENNIENAYVIGQHGKNMIYCLDEIKICGKSLKSYIKEQNIDENLVKQACDNTTNEGAKIIASAGATCFGPASSVKVIIDSFIKNDNKVLSLSVMHEDNNCYGCPVCVNKNGISIIDYEISEEEKEKLNKSIDCINELI